MLNSIGSANRTLIVLSPIYNQMGGYINITSVMMTQPGLVYFGAGFMNSTIPSQEQLLNCLDGVNASLVSCGRLIINAGNTTNWFQLPITTSSGVSQSFVYYMPTNEFLERQVLISNVANGCVNR